MPVDERIANIHRKNIERYQNGSYDFPGFVSWIEGVVNVAVEIGEDPLAHCSVIFKHFSDSSSPVSLVQRLYGTNGPSPDEQTRYVYQRIAGLAHDVDRNPGRFERFFHGERDGAQKSLARSLAVALAMIELTFGTTSLQDKDPSVDLEKAVDPQFLLALARYCNSCALYEGHNLAYRFVNGTYDEIDLDFLFTMDALHNAGYTTETTTFRIIDPFETSAEYFREVRGHFLEEATYLFLYDSSPEYDNYTYEERLARRQHALTFIADCANLSDELRERVEHAVTRARADERVAYFSSEVEIALAVAHITSDEFYTSFLKDRAHKAARNRLGFTDYARTKSMMTLLRECEDFHGVTNYYRSISTPRRQYPDLLSVDSAGDVLSDHDKEIAHQLWKQTYRTDEMMAALESITQVCDNNKDARALVSSLASTFQGNGHNKDAIRAAIDVLCVIRSHTARTVTR